MAVAKYPNQYTITFAPEPKTDANNPYHKFNVDVLQNAMNDLKKVGSLKLWMYLVLKSDMSSFGLSQKACEEWGIKKDSYYSAQEELVEKGYLKEIGHNKYEFTQVPMKMVVVPKIETKTPIVWDF